jgi:hypothetical protein
MISVRRERTADRRRRDEESRMTPTVDLHVQSNPVRVESDCIRAESIGSEEVALHGSGVAHRGGVRPSFNSGECLALLDEPAIGFWAMAAATEYGVTPGDALELLAYALLLDGQK